MSKAQEIIKYNLDNIDTLFNADIADWFEPLAEFVGTSICDGYCTNMKDSDDCVKSCALFHAMSLLKTEPTVENLNEVKAIICRILHNKLGG